MRTAVDVDETALQEAQAALGTTTKVETVNRALAEVAALAARRRDLQRLTSGDLSALGHEVLHRAAWRQPPTSPIRAGSAEWATRR
jgi:Arc/MetJ family transcription regulator